MGQISHRTKGAILLRKIAKNLTLRLSAEEYEQLKARSEIWGLKTEPTVRRIIEEADYPTRNTSNYSEALAKLNGIGKEINQIAYQANSKRSISEREINRAVCLVQQTYALIENIL